MTEQAAGAGRRLPRVAKMCLVAALLLVALWIDRHLLPALLWAVILAIATAPLHERLTLARPKLRDGLLVPSLFTAAFALVLLLPFAVVLLEAARERSAALEWIAAARINGVPLPSWVPKLPVGSHWVSGWWQQNLALPDAASRTLAQLHATALRHSRSWGGEALQRSVIFALTLLSYFFLLKERRSVVEQLQIAGDRLLGPTGERVARQLVLSVRGTINGLVFVGMGEGAVMAFLYWIAGAPHPILLGGLTAVAAMIPFGAIVVFLLAALLILAQGSALWAAAVILVGLIVVGVADHFVRPALIGGATRLPFLLVLFGILGGVETLGLLGLFIGPATMAALILLWRDFVIPAASPAAAPQGTGSEPAAQSDSSRC